MEYNAYLVVPFATWAVAQISKFALAAFRGKIDFRYLYASGGMPSVHSAVVCSLATTALLVGGVSSSIFGFTVIFAMIVMYDSLGVRRSSGEQAQAINMLIGSLDRSKVKIDQPDLRLREALGHKPVEVAVGGVLGVVLAAVFNYDRLGVFGQFAKVMPIKVEFYSYVAIFALLVVGGIVARLVLRVKYPKSRVIRELSRRVLALTQTMGLIGLVDMVLVYERTSYFAWRIWPICLLLGTAVWMVSLILWARKAVPSGLREEANTTRKLKWLRWGRGKKRKTKRG